MTWWIGLLVLGGCGGAKDSAPGLGFSTETVLQSEDFDSCSQSVYWPAGLYPLVVDRFDPPPPPYEITQIGAMLYASPGAFNSGRDCTNDAGLHVVVWLADSKKLDAPITSDLTIDVDPIAEGFATAEPSGEEGSFTLGTVVFDPPIRVEDAGALWIGMDAKGDSGSGPGGCLGGCGEAGDGAWRGDTTLLTWGDGDTSLPQFQITVAHD